VEVLKEVPLDDDVTGANLLLENSSQILIGDGQRQVCNVNRLVEELAADGA
jgi:hypothetical protein